MMLSTWSSTKFSWSVLFMCCIFAACLTHNGAIAQKPGTPSSSCSTNNTIRSQDLTDSSGCNPGYFIGRVELCDNGVWKSTICDYDWTVEDAMVVCRELNLITEGAVALNINQLSSERDIASIVPQCKGTESSVSQCMMTEGGVGCSQSNNSRIAAVACRINVNVPLFNLSSCTNAGQLQVVDALNAATTDNEPNLATNSSTTEQFTTATSTPFTGINNTPSSDSSPTVTVTGQTTSDRETGTPLNGLNLTIVYAAAGAAGGVVVLIIIVIILLVVVIAARRRKVSPRSPARNRKQSNTNVTGEIGTGSNKLNNTDISSDVATKHTIELVDPPIYEMLKDSNVNGSPSTSLKSGTDTTVPVYARLEGEQQYAQIEPHINTLPRDATKPTDSHYQSLNHSLSLTRNNSSSYQPLGVNKLAMAIESGQATESDVVSPNSTNSQNSSPERFKRALDLESRQDPSVNHSIEDLESQVSTNAVVNQRVIPETGNSHLYALLEAPGGSSPPLPPRMSNSLPRSAPSNKERDNRSNSMSRLKSNPSPKSLRSAANKHNSRPPKNKMSGNQGSPKLNRGMHSPYIQRGPLNSSRSSGLSSNTSGSGSTEGFVNSFHGEDSPRMNTLV